MCGITGIWSYRNQDLVPDQQLLVRMAAPMQFRGPDQDGFLLRTGKKGIVGFAHKRLSIIDLTEGGRQPMTSHDGRYSIVFNGEIYNFKEIKRQLQQTGYPFHSDSDTEVILAAVVHYGVEKVPKLLAGMFAFALFDHEEECMYLCRDRFGEKPLYYAHNSSFCAFSSDIRSFYSLPITLEIDEYALGYYFSEMCTPQSNSIYKNIHKLDPGCLLKIECELQTKETYWQPDYTEKLLLSEGEWLTVVEKEIESAVRHCSIADVDVGTFLSGGIDSSLITLLAARQSTSQLKTFCVGFEYEGFNELPFAAEVAKLADTDHHEIVLTIDDLPLITQLLGEYGEPFADSSQIPTYYVAKFASNHVKVVMGGDGGDEIFGGYRSYNQAWRMQQWYRMRHISPFLKTSKHVFSHQKVDYLLGVMQRDSHVLSEALYRSMGFNPNHIDQICTLKGIKDAARQENVKQMKASESLSNNLFDQILCASLKTRLVNDYLVKTDRATMFNSLELRSPFLYHPLTELVAKMPHKLLMKNGENKYITRKIAAKYFSDSFINREKMGFGIPIGIWMKSKWKKPVEEVLFSEDHLIPIEKKYLQKIWNEHQEGRADHTHRLWIIYVWKIWSRQVN
jgi:asparagine synthase (glutamine-hydrolysing)